MKTLVEQAGAALETDAGRQPCWAWFVPGRLEIFGKHTDYAGGRSLVAAVSRGVAVVAAPREDGLVRAIDAADRIDVQLDPGRDEPAFRGWRNYIAVVARRFAKNFPGAPLGTDIAFASNLPRAAGVSSSSAIVVGIAAALQRRGALDRRVEWTDAIRSPLDLAGYLGAVENGLTFGPLAGASGVGTFGGSEDHTAILTSQSGRVSAYAYVPVRHLGSAAVPDDWRFAVMSSGVHAAKAGRTRDRYNRASLATRALIDLWNARSSRPAATLGALLSGDPEGCDRLREMVPRDGWMRFTRDELCRRLEHFVREDARVPLALDAFRHADHATLGVLSDASQGDADRLLGNQVDETRELARLARSAGALGASSFGAGFGGSVWALVRRIDAAAFAAEWREAYARRYPARHGIETFISRPENGLLPVSL